ncbi:hypothetical protein DFQ29_002746 [Apophysomyces sp. BC1021]|nr:hypothetical protein DFQ29_002746 [Apophysomyces sp. BC1021]
MVMCMGDGTDDKLCPGDYDPYYIENDSSETFGVVPNSQGTSPGFNLRPADAKREMNEHFHQSHSEIIPEITLSKIKAIKAHLLEIGEAADVEISSIAHAYVYFEKLVIKVEYV